MAAGRLGCAHTDILGHCLLLTISCTNGHICITFIEEARVAPGAQSPVPHDCPETTHACQAMDDQNWRSLRPVMSTTIQHPSRHIQHNKLFQSLL